MRVPAPRSAIVLGLSFLLFGVSAIGVLLLLPDTKTRRRTTTEQAERTEVLGPDEEEYQSPPALPMLLSPEPAPASAEVDPFESQRQAANEDQRRFSLFDSEVRDNEWATLTEKSLEENLTKAHLQIWRKEHLECRQSRCRMRLRGVEGDAAAEEQARMHRMLLDSPDDCAFTVHPYNEGMGSVVDVLLECRGGAS